MKLFAVDCRQGQADSDPFAVASWSDLRHSYETDWDAWKLEAVEHAKAGYTMVAHGAEQVVTYLLHNRDEYVRVDYRSDEYQWARWYYDSNHEPMPIWDSRPLSGNLPWSELVTGVGLIAYPTPQRHTWQHRKRWAERCWSHKVVCCPLCRDVVDRWYWRCAEHDQGECEECWRMQHACAVYRYMDRYARMAEGYGVKPSRTIGGMAMRLWRTIDRPAPIKLATREMDEFARLGYRAGRTECFKLGATGPVTYGDVSQMYASILQEIHLPTPETTQFRDVSTLEPGWMSKPGISDCTVCVPHMYLPPLGIMTKTGFVFPVGEFRGHFTHGELRMAVERGCEILEVHKSLFGTDTTQPMGGFAAGMVSWREDLRRSKDPLELVVKQLLVSLYGMLGMKPWHDTEYVQPLPPGTDMADWPFHDFQILPTHILMRRSDRRYRRGDYANPLWAALITAEARIRLYKLMEQHGGEMVYCDTDSIITMGELRDVGNAPGQLRYQGFYEQSWILAPKLYRLQGTHNGERNAHAGIPQWQLDRLIQEGRARKSAPVGILESFWTGLEAGRWVTMPVERKWEIGKRQPVSSYDVLTEGGWTDTRPLVLGPAFTESVTTDEL